MSLPDPTTVTATRRDSKLVNVEDVHREAAGLLGISVRVTARADIGTEHRRSDLRHAPGTLYPHLRDPFELLHGGRSDVHAAPKERG